MMGVFVHKGIRAAVKSIKFVNDSMLHIILGGRLCDYIVLNVHSPTGIKVIIEMLACVRI
jgi:hypothetical protein